MVGTAKSLPLPTGTLQAHRWRLDLTEGPEGYGVDTAGNDAAAGAEAGGYVALQLMQHRLARWNEPFCWIHTHYVKRAFMGRRRLQSSGTGESEQALWSRWVDEGLSADGDSVTDAELGRIFDMDVTPQGATVREALRRDVVADVRWLQAQFQRAEAATAPVGARPEEVAHLARLRDAINDEVDDVEAFLRGMPAPGDAFRSRFRTPPAVLPRARGRAARAEKRARVQRFIDQIFPTAGPGAALTMLSRAVAENPSDEARALLAVAEGCDHAEALLLFSRDYAGLLDSQRPSGHGALVMAYQLRKLLS